MNLVQDGFDFSDKESSPDDLGAHLVKKDSFALDYENVEYRNSLLIHADCMVNRPGFVGGGLI